MWMQIFGMMGGTYVPATEPSVASVSVASLSGGSCSGTHVGTNAKVRASWVINNPSDTAYTAKVYKNGVISQIVSASASGTDTATAPGVEGDPHNQTTVNWVWRVDVVRNSDSAIISSKSSATFTESYGNCNGPA
jgi:hypothetical protein